MTHIMLSVALLLAALLVPPAPLGAQGAAARLTSTLGADAAGRILERVAAARSRGLPAATLEQRALELAAKGVSPVAIELQVSADEAALAAGRRALAAARPAEPRASEIEGAAALIRRGVSAGAVSALAATADPLRPLGVPLFVVSSLLDQGEGTGAAVTMVASRLAAGVSDAELVELARTRAAPVPPPPPVRGAVEASRPPPRPVPTLSAPRVFGDGPQRHRP